MAEDNSGYVYILEVADIDLAVCKIGMTTRDPLARCQEINKSSTGDFIWSVAYSVAVDDCIKLEKFIHHKLNPLRQKRREFFNLCAEDAYKAVISIIASQDEIKIVNLFDSAPTTKVGTINMVKKKSLHPGRGDSAENAALLLSFCEVLKIKGRAFGQLNKPFFGMSDGNEGVQWNIAVYPLRDEVRIGVNLEGMMYRNWPISRLIKAELAAPELMQVIGKISPSEEIYMTFSRDAWQAASRPEIKEKYLGGKEYSLAELTYEKWHKILLEALDCLDKERDYQKRNIQNVTLLRKDGSHQIRAMQVSPHLTIWSRLKLDDDIESAIRHKMAQLHTLYNWMTTSG